MARTRGRGIPITPQQMAAQWLPLRHKFELGVWNFQVEAARAAVGVFQQSFDLGRFNDNGASSWKGRTRAYKHPILNETGSLKNSITYRKQDKNSMRVYTAPSAFGSAARHKGFCYAAVHNDPNGSHIYGRTGVPSKQRQFMGYSSVLDKKMKQLVVKIFESFPK